jgi:DNA polymerase-3 subunit alpha
MGNQDKTIKNIAECPGMGIKILPPDINESQADFSVVEGKIRFGLAAVKNVGLKALESAIEEREAHGPFRDLLDFCKRIEGSKVNHRVLECLIQCGAFDFTGIYRSRLFGALDNVLKFCGSNQDPNQLNIFGSLDLRDGQSGGLIELPDCDEWDDKEKLGREKEALGFYITGHPLARFKREIEQFTTCTVQELPSQKDKSQVKIACVVGNLKMKRTRRGDKMATMVVEDLTGSTLVIIFPDVFNRTSPLLKSDEPLLINGSVETGDTSAKIIAQDIVTLNSVRQNAIKAIELRLVEKAVSKEFVDDLQDIVFTYPGECSLLFKMNTNNGKEIVIAAHDRFKVLPCQELIDKIELLIGNKIIVHEKRNF